MDTTALNGTWKVRVESLACKGAAGLKKVSRTRSGWMEARVPGEVHLDLIRAGRMPEPLVSNNAPKCRWPEKKSWWYRTTFDASSRLLTGERQQLVFEGLDLYAQVFLNGALIGEATNALVPAVFDVRHRLKQKHNDLLVRLSAGTDLLPPSLQPQPRNRTSIYGTRNRFPGLPHLRKPQFTYGWDWVDALPNIGIWRGAQLEGRSGIILHDLRLDTRLEGRKARVRVTATIENLHPWSERHGRLEIMFTPPSGPVIRQRVPVTAQVGRSTMELTVEIPNAQLWWPNGMGSQPLYGVTARVWHGNVECDCKTFAYGLRTVEINRSPLKAGGSRFCIRVNGQDVFCKGANWIPADAIIARVNRTKYQALVAEAKAANMNMLRVWGGGIYEDPAFYEACDQNGILVWQDFMFACAEYPDHDPAFCNAVRHEAEAVIRRLRHHPCIALWCGNNENIVAFSDWWNKGKSLNDKDLKLGGSAIYNRILPDACGALDPARPYWPSSPCGGENPNSETEGDCHWWNQATMNADMTRRIRHEVFDECRSRFVSEYGIIGPCHMESLRAYLRPGERRVGSRAWGVHTNQFEKDTLAAGIARHYMDSQNLALPDYVRYGQMFQAMMYGQSLEALRFRKHDPRDDCQGALIWMFNDCWGETGWTIIDYYLRRKPSYYAFRRACTPVKAIVRQRGRALVTRVINDTRHHCTVVLHSGWIRVDGTATIIRPKKLVIPANSMRQVRVDLSRPARGQNLCEWIYAAWLTGEGLAYAPSIWMPAPFRQMRCCRPEIRMSIRNTMIELVSPVYCHGVHAPDQGRALLSDNYFDLLPNVSVQLHRLEPRGSTRPRFQAITLKTPAEFSQATMKPQQKN